MPFCDVVWKKGYYYRFISKLVDQVFDESLARAWKERQIALRLLGLKVAPKAAQLLTIHAHNPDYAWGFLERFHDLTS